MKEAVVLVLVSALLVGGIGIWLASGNSLPFFSVQPSADQPAGDLQPGNTPAGSDAAKNPAPPKPLKSPAVKSAKKKTPPIEETIPEAVVVGPVAEVVVAPPPPPKQFPSANEISVGITWENIAEKFGQPALATTTTSDDGRVLETLVYARKSGRDVTVIRIEDGKVLSAYSR